MAAFVGRREDVFETRRHFRPVRIQRLHETRPAAKSHRLCDALAVVLVLGEFMCLRVIEVLQAVLHPPQEVVRGVKLGDRFRLQKPATVAGLGQALEHRQSWAFTQRRIAPAANQLQRLGDEFDLAYPAGTELDVAGEFATRHFRAHFGVQFAHRRDRTEIEVLAKHEGTHDRIQPRVVIARKRATLDPCVAFPLASLADEVILQSVEAHRERSGIAPRAKAHIDAEHPALRIRRGDEADESPPKAHEEFVIGERSLATARLAVLGVHEHQIDVGGHVEFAAPELAHPDDDQLLRGSRTLANRLAVRGREPRMQQREPLPNGYFRERGHHGADLRQRCTVEVARDRAQHHPLAQPP